jgi:hypothetical protein
MHFQPVTILLEKKILCRIIDHFYKRSDLAISILGCPFFGGYYSGLLKVVEKLFTGLGT